MSPDTRNRRRLAAIGAAAAACAVAVGLAPASAATQDTASSAGHHRCVHLSFTEPTVRFYTNETISSVTTPPVGLMGIYLDPLWDASGNQVGQTAGEVEMLYTRASDGHLIEYIAETLQLPAGSLFSAGTYDRAGIEAADVMSAPIKGVSGAYLGMSGTWNWSLVSRSAPFPVQEKVTLCRDDGR
jgi:hypothetical protein